MIYMLACLLVVGILIQKSTYTSLARASLLTWATEIFQ